MKLTSKEAAAFLGVAQSTMSRWIKAGLLKGERDGKMLLVLRADLLGFKRPERGRPVTEKATLARTARGSVIHAVRNGRGLCGWQTLQWVEVDAMRPTCKRCKQRLRYTRETE